LDRSEAERLLTGKVDGTFVLRRKTDTTAVIDCRSRGKVEHHLLTLVENKAKTGGNWVYKKEAFDEIAMFDVARSGARVSTLDSAVLGLASL